MQAHKVTTDLKDEDWGPFHELLRSRRSTINQMHKWLCGRGYTISRSAVFNYVHQLRRREMFPAREALGARSDAELRQKIAGWTAELSGGELATLGILAAFLVEAVRRATPEK